MYYLLGVGKEQLAVWYGQEIWTNTGCDSLPIGEVAMYPVEYNSPVGGLARVSTNVTQAPEGLKLFHIADHLGSVRVSLDSVGRLAARLRAVRGRGEHDAARRRRSATDVH